MGRLEAVQRLLYGTPLAISEPGLHLISGIIEAHLSGVRLTPDEARAAADSRQYGSGGSEGSGGAVALINLHGPIMSRASSSMTLSGYTDPQAFAARVRAAADNPDVARIVLSIDSPGGSVSGTRTAADAVAYARDRKDTVAVADDIAASAAYWIGAQASTFVVDPGGTVGSIGVIMALRDTSEKNAKDGVQVHVLRSGEQKALGQPGEAITDETLAHYREQLAIYHDQFVQAVADGRGVPLATAQGWATGRTWIGQAAVDAGVADRTGTLREALAGSYSPPPAARPAASTRPSPARAETTGRSTVTPEQLAALGLQADATPQDIQAALDRQRHAAEAHAAQSTRIVAGLALAEGQQAPADPLGALSAQASDGRTYREAQLDRLHALTITTEGNDEAGIQAADDARKVYAGQPLPVIAAQITRLEAKRDSLPGGPVSRQPDDKTSAQKPLPASAYGVSRRR